MKALRGIVGESISCMILNQIVFNAIIGHVNSELNRSRWECASGLKDSL